ncbi:glycosyltransferase family 1 protein [Backusella circina FSU 941]|nr:glycosyltransferase family 1 protein [Backusella circina FSU 941]
MVFISKLSVQTLFSASIFLLSNLSPVVATESNADLLTLRETYFESKNIGFVAPMGGSSHMTWVLTILDELNERGHNITFFTREDSVRFSKAYPKINTVSLGPESGFDPNLFEGIEELETPYQLFGKVFESAATPWETDFYALTNYFISSNLSIVICDNMSDVCNQAAIAAKLPFIVTATSESTSASAAPYVNNNGALMEEYTTEFLSLSQRFKDRFVFPLNFMWHISGVLRDITKRQKAIGVNAPLVPTWAWGDSLKIVNNYFGMTPPRPLGPLVEFVGPIIPRKYARLNADFENYLKTHKKVAYVAFGQHVKPSPNTINLILTALFQVYEAGELDGIIWAGDIPAEKLSKNITTSGTIYNGKHLIANEYPDIKFVKWAPQVAVLFHPSVQLFVSHGGFGSCIEALYTGVPTVFFPFFGDQTGNAMMLKRANVGEVLRKTTTIPEATDKIKRILADKDGEIKKNLKRMQAITQIRSRNGAKVGADLIEEVAFSSIEQKIPHRYEASRNMSFIKAHNIDIYGILLVLVSGALIMLGLIFYNSIKAIKTILKSQKKEKSQ